MAAASFLLVGALFRSVASPSGGPLVGAKREYFAAHAERFDTVFLGSSHVYRGFVPGEFDRLARAAGVQSTSFNYGVQLPNLIECLYLVRELVETAPGLERIFFEYQTLTPQIDPANAFQPRALYWHDLAETRRAAERSLHWGSELGGDFTYVEDPASARSGPALLGRVLPPAWRAAGDHVQHGLTELLFTGRAKDVGRGALGRMHGQALRFDAEAGYVSLEGEERRLSERGQVDNPYSRRRTRFAGRREAYLEDVRRLTEEAAVFGDDEWMNAELVQVHDVELVAEIVRTAHDAGVELILVVMPQQSADREVEKTLAERTGAPLLRYNRPDRYPELYAPENRFDSGHLSEEGARLFTRHLAGDYLRATLEAGG